MLVNNSMKFQLIIDVEMPLILLRPPSPLLKLSLVSPQQSECLDFLAKSFQYFHELVLEPNALAA